MAGLIACTQPGVQDLSLFLGLHRVCGSCRSLQIRARPVLPVGDDILLFLLGSGSHLRHAGFSGDLRSFSPGIWEFYELAVVQVSSAACGIGHARNLSADPHCAQGGRNAAFAGRDLFAADCGPMPANWSVFPYFSPRACFRSRLPAICLWNCGRLRHCSWRHFVGYLGKDRAWIKISNVFSVCPNCGILYCGNGLAGVFCSP